MNIKNGTKEAVSWFCYNQSDAAKLIALASGNLGEGESKTSSAPHNDTGWYAVRFTYEGGGTELAMGAVSLEGDIMLVETDAGAFQTVPHL